MKKVFSTLLMILGFILLGFGLTLMIKASILAILVMLIGFIALMVGLLNDAKANN